jgi:hypothetical protein
MFVSVKLDYFQFRRREYVISIEFMTYRENVLKEESLDCEFH